MQETLDYAPDLTPELVEQRIRRYLDEIENQTKQDYRGQDGVFLVYGGEQSGSVRHSHTPALALLKGRFEDVLRLAVQLRDFCTWSEWSGGRVERVALHDAGHPA